MNLVFIGAIVTSGIILLVIFYIYYKMSENESKYDYLTSFISTAPAPASIGSRIS